MRASRSRALVAALVAGLVACLAMPDLARADSRVSDGSAGGIPRLLSERENGVCAYIDLEAVAAYGIRKLRRSMLMYYNNRRFYEVMAGSVFRMFEQRRDAISREVDLVDCEKVQHVANDEPDRDRLRPYMLHMRFAPTGYDLQAVCIGVAFPIGESLGQSGYDTFKPFGTSQPVTRTIDGRDALWSPCFDRRGKLTGFRPLGIAE